MPVRSAGLANRPAGTAGGHFGLLLARGLAFQLGEHGVDMVPMGSPSTTPGAMAFTLMPCLIRFSPADCVIEITAALVEQ